MFGMWDVGCLLECGIMVYKMPLSGVTSTFSPGTTDLARQTTLFGLWKGGN